VIMGGQLPVIMGGQSGRSRVVNFVDHGCSTSAQSGTCPSGRRSCRNAQCSWLYLHQLDSIETVRRLVAFYVQQHNEVVPHSTFKGATPDEVYFELAGGVAAHLKARRAEAQTLRLANNRRNRACSAPPRRASLKRSREFYLPNPAQRSLVQLQRIRSRMS
jgi:hypothetical protein